MMSELTKTGYNFIFATFYPTNFKKCHSNAIWSPYHILMVRYLQIKLENIMIILSAIPWWLGCCMALFYSLYTAMLVLGNIQLSAWTSMTFRPHTDWTNITDGNSSDVDWLVDVENSRAQRTELVKYSLIVTAQR